MKTFQTIALLAVTCLIAVAWAQSPPTPPMSLHNLKQAKRTGNIITITNRITTVTMIGGVTNSAVESGSYTERVELLILPGGEVRWEQVNQ